MNIKVTCGTGTALLSATLLVFTSCSTTPKPSSETSSTSATVPGVPGGVYVNTHKMKSTITDIDKASRKVTLLEPNGKKATVIAGPAVVNFDQLRVNDQVTATVTEELAVHLAGAGAPASSGGSTTVALATKGGTPGGFIAETVQVTARVSRIDHRNHAATLVFPDGSAKTFAVRPDVDLTLRSVGEQVVIRVTASYAIAVEKR